MIEALKSDRLENFEEELTQPCNLKNNFFLWLSAADPETLKRCPKSEQTRQAALGATVLIPTIFSVIASSYIAFNLNLSLPLKIIIPILWCFIILTLDRALLATYQAKVIQVIFRLTLALFISITISHPVTLAVFHEQIEHSIYKKYKEKRIEDIKNESNEYDKSYSKSILDFQSQKKDINKKLEDCRNGSNFSNIYSKKTIALQTEKQQLIAQLEEKKTQITNLYISAKQEELGKGRSGQPGKGPIYDSIISKISSIEKTIPSMEKRINTLDEREKISIDDDYEKRTEAEKKKDAECGNIELSVNKSLDKISERILKYKDQNIETTEEYRKKIKDIEDSESDILQRTLALHEIIMDKENGGNAALAIFVSFIFLFILIDTIPILLKIFSKGCYEYQLQFNEMELKHKVKAYPSLLKESASDQVNREIKLRNKQRTLNLISTVMCDKSEMLYDFLDMRKKYFSYLENNFGLDKEKIQDIVNSENIDLTELLKQDNENIINTFFSSRVDDKRENDRFS